MGYRIRKQYYYNYKCRNSRIKLMKYLFLIPFFTFGQLDKDGSVKHFYAGAGISFVTGSIINHYTDKPGLSCLVGFGAGTLAGLGKEYIYDKQWGKGVFSKDDYRITAWGSLCASIVLRCVIDYRQVGLKPRKNKYKYSLN